MPPSCATPAVTGGGAATPADAPEFPPIDPEAYECVRDAEALQVWIDAIRHTGVVAVDTETTGLDDMRADLVGVCLAVEPGRACYIPLAHKSGADDLFGSGSLADGQMDMDRRRTLW